jgi:hypothetical protein
MSKYRAIKTNGYHSKKESERADELRLMQRAGLISELREQVVYEIAPSVVVKGRKRPAMKYVADFVYAQDGKQVVEDVKGFRTTVYTMKAHLMMAVHGIAILETYGATRRRKP